MRLANLDGRALLVTAQGLIDVEEASHGRFAHRIDDLIPMLDELIAWYDEATPMITDPTTPDELLSNPNLGPSVTVPGQVFAIGVNYRAHAEEMGLIPPAKPMVFTKFPSSVAGANAMVALPSKATDWEAELVVVIGKRGRNVSTEDALSYVAGYCVGQDFSDRALQLEGNPAQFSLGKSHEHFAPVGPWLTTADEVSNPNALHITCDVNGHRYQDSTTADMVFSVRHLVSYLSTICELRPGDIVFTGSPHGVGQGQHPPVFLKSGDVVTTTIDGLGSLRNVARAR